jgi:hypothetical protein
MVVVVGLFFFPGLLMWGIAAVLFLRGRSAGRGGIDVQGEVYGHSEYMSRGQLMYAPKYRAIVNGQTLMCSGTTATNWKRPPVGTPVNLVFVPGDPETPLRERGLPMGILIAVIMLTVFGTAFLVIGTLAVVSMATAVSDNANNTGNPANTGIHAPSKRTPSRQR